MADESFGGVKSTPTLVSFWIFRCSTSLRNSDGRFAYIGAGLKLKRKLRWMSDAEAAMPLVIMGAPYGLCLGVLCRFVFCSKKCVDAKIKRSIWSDGF